MKNFIFALLFFAVLPGCGSSDLSMLSDADRVVVTFTGESPQEVEIKDKAQLQILQQLISDTQSPQYKCGYSGEIKYYKGDNMLLSGEFNMSEDCSHIVFFRGDALHSRKMSPEGAKLLQTLAAKVPKKPKASLEALTWMLGDWEQKEKDGSNSRESWKRKDAQSFGAVVTARPSVDVEPVVIETIELKQQGEDIFYIPNVAHNSGPVPFKLIAITTEPKSVTFANPEHDFPQEISYFAVGDTMLHARISGIRDGEVGVKDFYLRLVE